MEGPGRNRKQLRKVKNIKEEGKEEELSYFIAGTLSASLIAKEISYAAGKCSGMFAPLKTLLMF